MTVFIGESTEAVLKCEVYGYPRDSSPPVWTHGSDELHNGRYTTTVTNAGLLSGNSISTTERVVSQLTIFCVSEADEGNYTCSFQGNHTNITLSVVEGNCMLWNLFLNGAPRNKDTSISGTPFCCTKSAVFAYISTLKIGTLS